MNRLADMRSMAAAAAVLAAVALCGCGAADTSQGRRLEEQGHFAEAYESYYKALESNAGDSAATAGLKRTAPQAKDHWQREAFEAAEAGQWQRAAAGHLKVLQIQPNELSSILSLRDISRRHPEAIQAAGGNVQLAAAEQAAPAPEKNQPSGAGNALPAESPQATPAVKAPVAKAGRAGNSLPAESPVDQPVAGAPAAAAVAVAKAPQPQPAPSRYKRPTVPATSAEKTATAAKTAPRSEPWPPAEPVAAKPLDKPAVADAELSGKSQAAVSDSDTPPTPTGQAPLLVYAPRPSAEPAADSSASETAAADDEALEKAELAASARKEFDLGARPPDELAPAEGEAPDRSARSRAAAKSSASASQPAGPRPVMVPVRRAAPEPGRVASPKLNPHAQKPDVHYDLDAGDGEFIQMVRLSTEDRRYERNAALYGGLSVRLRGTDDDPDHADMEFFLSGKKIARFKKLIRNNVVTLVAATGTPYEVVVTAVSDDTETVTLGLRLAGSTPRYHRE